MKDQLAHLFAAYPGTELIIMARSILHQLCFYLDTGILAKLCICSALELLM